MKGDQMGIRAAHPTPRELPLSNQTWFRCNRICHDGQPVAGLDLALDSAGDASSPVLALTFC